MERWDTSIHLGQGTSTSWSFLYSILLFMNTWCLSPSAFFAQDAINNKAPQCVCLKQQKFIVSLLEAGTSRPWSWFLLKTVRDHLFRAPAFGDLRAICANLYSLPHPVLCHHLYLAFSPCLCVSATKFPLLIRIPVFPD